MSNRPNWQVIIVILIVQLIVGALVLGAAAKEFSGPLGGAGIAAVYVCMVAAYLVICFIQSLRITDEAIRKIWRLCILFTLLLWSVVPFAIAALDPLADEIQESIRDHGVYSNRRKGMKWVIEEMHLKDCVPDEQYRAATLEREDGRKMEFELSDVFITVHCAVIRHPLRDSLAWTEELLKCARPFLPPDKQYSAAALLKDSVGFKIIAYSQYIGLKWTHDDLNSKSNEIVANTLSMGNFNFEVRIPNYLYD